MTLTEKWLRGWAEAAKAGESITYYSGANAADGENKHITCAAAWNLFTSGDVALFQRRVGKHMFDYIAVRIRSPKAKAFWSPQPEKSAAARERAKAKAAAGADANV